MANIVKSHIKRGEKCDFCGQMTNAGTSTSLAGEPIATRICLDCLTDPLASSGVKGRIFSFIKDPERRE